MYRQWSGQLGLVGRALGMPKQWLGRVREGCTPGRVERPPAGHWTSIHLARE